MLIINSNDEALSYLKRQPGADTLLYVPMETDLLDHSGNNVSITNYWISLNTTVLQSMGVWYFKGGSEDRLEFSGIPFWTNTFTISRWEKTGASSNGTGSRFSSAWNWGNNWAWLLLGYQWTDLYVWNWGTAWNIISGAKATNSTTNTWVHWTIVREGNARKTYKNKTLYWSGNASGSIWYNTEVIGNYRPWDKNPYYGYMAQFIIEKKARSQADISEYHDKIKDKFWLS